MVPPRRTAPRRLAERYINSPWLRRPRPQWRCHTPWSHCPSRLVPTTTTQCQCAKAGAQLERQESWETQPPPSCESRTIVSRWTERANCVGVAPTRLMSAATRSFESWLAPRARVGRNDKAHAGTRSRHGDNGRHPTTVPSNLSNGPQNAQIDGEIGLNAVVNHRGCNGWCRGA
jgi:hypothetical protein